MTNTTDTPRTDACPHCGADYYTQGTWMCDSYVSGTFRSALCYSREKSQKLEAEVERLSQKLSITEDELADAREWLDERYKATSEADERAEKAEAEVERLDKERRELSRELHLWEMNCYRRHLLT